MSNVLDGLLEKVEDAALRAALSAEVARLRDTKDFGLVFERHIPERVRLYGRPPTRGGLVQSRANGADVTWRVRRISDGSATLIDEEGLESKRPIEELVVVSAFGDPIYPALKDIGSIERGIDKPFSTVINGENYHALQALRYLYRGQVDCIYIDPPFNSGARDWKYNNHYVDNDDAYRHSKWLAFIERRLLLAKELLNPQHAALIVAIDENEVHRLTLLLEQIFPSSKIQMVTVLINPAGASIIDQFARVDEHLLFVHIGSARPLRTIAETTPLGAAAKAIDGDDESPAPARKKFIWESVQRSGGNSRRQDTKAKFFPIYIDEKARRVVGAGDHLPEGLDRATVSAPPKGCIQQWPIKQDGSEACWQLSAPTFRQYLEAGRVRLGRKKSGGSWGLQFLTKGHMKAIGDGELVVRGRDEHGALIVENSQDQARTRVGKTMWTNGRYSSTEHGSTLLRKFIPGRKFPFPKSLYAVEDALRFYVGDNPDALVVDFFAGSGTTAHAVARLNHQDGGARRCISVTNNEVSEGEAAALADQGALPGESMWESLGIFEYITRPRIEAAITGKTSDGAEIEGNYRFVDEFPIAEGFPENVRFFELTYLDPNTASRGKAFEAIAPLLWLKAGAVGPEISRIKMPYAMPRGARYAVLFDVAKWRRFVDAVATAQGVTHVFIVTDSLAQYQQIVAELPTALDTSMLYEDYLSNFELTVGPAT